jgi:copper transport protein
VVHVLAAALWLGGVVLLALMLRNPARPRGADRATDRFAQIALPAIVVVSVSGTVQAWRQVESWGALWHTVYGRTLLVKMLVVGAVVVVASSSRDVLRHRVLPAVRRAFTPGPGAMLAERPQTHVRDLRNAVWVEVLLALVVLAVTAGLVNAEPAREVAANVPRTYSASLAAEQLEFRIAIQPTLPGVNTVVVTTLAPDGSAATPEAVTGSVALPGKVAPIPLQFVAIGKGKYASSVVIPLAGSWTVDVNAQRTKFDASSAETHVQFG